MLSGTVTQGEISGWYVVGRGAFVVLLYFEATADSFRLVVAIPTAVSSSRSAYSTRTYTHAPGTPPFGCQSSAARARANRDSRADCSIGCMTTGTRSGPASPTAPTCATQTGHDPDEALLRHRHTPCQTRTRHGPQVARASSTDRCGSQTRTNPVRKPVRVMAATGAGAPDKENADADDRQTDRDRETRDLSRGPPQVVVWRIDAASGAQPHGHIQQSATARTCRVASLGSRRWRKDKFAHVLRCAGWQS